jgi:teichuronic acid biosynthesis glycosyltransferase TuaG
MNNPPQVSILMPCYNSELYLDKAIESVFSQTYSDWELLICDDGSTDSSYEIAQRYSRTDCRIKSIKNIYDRGAPGARNSCLKLSSGRFIAFLDSDDYWLPEKLENQIQFMTREQISFSYSYHDILNEKGEFQHTCKAPSSVGTRMMSLSNFIPCLTAIYDTKTFGKVPQPDIISRNDFALWLTLLNKEGGLRAYCLPMVTARYRSNSYGLSSNIFRSISFFGMCLRRYNRVSYLGSVIYTGLYLVLVLIKKRFPVLYNYVVTRA